MSSESDELADALSNHERVTQEYVRVEQKIQSTQSTQARRRRYWTPLAVVMALVLAAPLAVFAGRSHFTPHWWPNAATTGPPPGTPLTTYTGPCAITTPNTVIDSKIVDCGGWLAIQAANVQVINSTVKDGIWLDVDLPGGPGWSVTVADSIVDGGPHDLPTICCANLTILRTEMFGGHNGAQCDGGVSPAADATFYCVIKDSYIHGQYNPPGAESHLGGFLTDGGIGSGIQLIHNSIVCDAPANDVSGGCTGDINLIPNFGLINNVQITDNLLGANVESAYCTFGGEKPGAANPHATNIVYRDNVFERGPNNLCGAYGPWTSFSLDPTDNPGNAWINNRYTDGTVIPGP